nr:hypothetical protein [Eubacterium sp.]
MVELFEQDVQKNGRQSSKGNQLKWLSWGVWYKADYTGYEGLVCGRQSFVARRLRIRSV